MKDGKIPNIPRIVNKVGANTERSFFNIAFNDIQLQTQFAMKSLLLFIFINVLSYSTHAQRYFEFHFPPKTAGADPYPGRPGEEFIVKMSDTSLFWKMEEDLFLHDSLKQWYITGWIRPSVEDYNKPWRWEYRDDTLMILENGQYSGCNRLPSYIDEHLEQWMSGAWNGWTCPWGSVVKQEVFPSTVVLNNSVTVQVSLYPNPVVDIAYVQIPTDIIGSCELLVYSSTGKLVAKQIATGGSKLILKRADFPSSGTYLYSVKSKNGIFSAGKFLIE